MRVLGFDLYYDSLLSNRKIIEISKRDNRIILTKSRKLLEFKDVTHGIYIRHGTTTEQIRQIIDYLDIKDDQLVKISPLVPAGNALGGLN